MQIASEGGEGWRGGGSARLHVANVPLRCAAVRRRTVACASGAPMTCAQVGLLDLDNIKLLGVKFASFEPRP